MVEPLISFLFQSVLHNWFYKGHDMYNTVCVMVHIKESIPHGGTAPRPKTREPVIGLVVGMPEPSVDMGMLIILSPPHPPHLVEPLSFFLSQSVLHNWFNKGHGMYYPVYGMVHIQDPLLLIEKSSPCGGSWFPLSLSEWSFIICLMQYNHK